MSERREKTQFITNHYRSIKIKARWELKRLKTFSSMFIYPQFHFPISYQLHIMLSMTKKRVNVVRVNWKNIGDWLCRCLESNYRWRWKGPEFKSIFDLHENWVNQKIQFVLLAKSTIFLVLKVIWKISIGNKLFWKCLKYLFMPIESFPSWKWVF